MTALLNRQLNGRPYLLNTTAVVTPPAPSGPMSQAFTLTNWGSASSLGVHKRGVWFKKGDVPTGSIPALSSGTMQLYGIGRWSDGSLKRARLMLRDAGLIAGASRSYTMTAVVGALSGSVAATGNAGLVSALSGHDFKVTFSNVKDSTGATYGGGTLTASLATHATISTRWTLLTTGAVADVWQGWGVAGSDAHLKVNWYLTRWKNADGSTLAWQIGAAPALDWWSAAGKSDLTYDAALTDGSTPIVSFVGVQHYYHSHWLMCINDGGLNAGAAPWAGAARPTLHCTFDKPYAVSTNLIPPYRTDKTPAPAPQFAYVPCNVVAENTSDHNNSHRTIIDAVGLYQGRGAITRFDADHFMAQTPSAFAVMLTNALTGLSVPFHHKSSRNRARPGESADVANTNIVLLMHPKADSTSDFTAQGLPVAVDAYRNGPSPTDNWLAPATLSSNPWASGTDSSHAVTYSYYAGLITGEEWFVDAQLDLALYLAHQNIFTYHQNVKPFADTYGIATPSATWTGLLGQWQQQNMRYVGWSQLVAGHAFGGLPDDHPYKPAATALMSHQGDYIAATLDLLTADFAAAGVYFPADGNYGLYSPWMAAFGAIGAYCHYLCNEDARWKRLGDHIGHWAIDQATAGRFYMWDAYRTTTRRKFASYDPSTNPLIPVAQQPYLELSPTLGSDGFFTQSAGNQWQVNGCYPPPLRNGDPMTFTVLTDGGSGNAAAVPGVAEGTLAYVVNLVPGSGLTGRNSPTTPPRWQLSLTLGGTPMTFGGATVSGVGLVVCPQSVADPAYAVQGGSGDYLIFPYYGDWTNYMPPNNSVVQLARQAGNSTVTASLRDKAVAFMAPMDTGPYAYYSAFDMASAA